MSNAAKGSSGTDTYVDPVIEAYKGGVDGTLIRENLKRSPQERVDNLMRLQKFSVELKRAGSKASRV